MKFMKKPALALTTIALSAMFSIANAQHADKDIKEDITRHRAMAKAHENAAKCLESGKKHDACVTELQTACKGVGIGKYCGLKHSH